MDLQTTKHLLGYVDAAIRVVNDGNDTAVMESLNLLRGELVNASKSSGESVVIAPLRE